MKRVKGFVKGIFKLLGVILMLLLIVIIGSYSWILISAGDLSVFIRNYPQISGLFSQEKTYLIVFQNNNELRSTGGFISSYGILEFKSGIPTKLEVEDVYGNTVQLTG